MNQINLETECCICTENIDCGTNPQAKKQCKCSAVMCTSCAERYLRGQKDAHSIIVCPVCKHAINNQPVIAKLRDPLRMVPDIPGCAGISSELRMQDVKQILQHAKILNNRVIIYCTCCSSARTPPMFSSPKGFVSHLKQDHGINIV